MADATGLGDVPFFFVELDSQWAGICNAMAAGVMLAASFDLIQEGQDHGSGSWVVIGILAGGIFIWLCKKVCILEGVIKKIHTACRNFFWSSKHPAISWKTVCMPKECRGLGLRNLQAWNKSFLCKLIWNIHSKKDSLWIKWIQHYYFHDIWTYSTRKEDSTLIKSIINIRNVLRLSGESTEMVVARLQTWFNGPNSSMDLPYQWFSHNRQQWPWKPILCKAGILPKHGISFWLFAHKKFLTKDRQPYIQDKICVLCGIQDETFDHLFFECGITKDLWGRIREWLGLTKLMGSATALLRAFRGIYRGSTTVDKMRTATIAATIYHIWEIRNRKIFDGVIPDLGYVVRQIQILIHRMHALRMTYAFEE